MPLLLSVTLLPSVLVVAAGGAWLAVKQPWEPHCADAREACAQSESFSGDHTFPQVLARFGLPDPCGTRGLQYAYSDDWNDNTETLAIHTTISPSCLREFLALIAPGFDPHSATPVRVRDVGFPMELGVTGFPNGALGPLDSADHYAATTRQDDAGREMDLAVDVDTAAPVLDLLVRFDAPDAWASPGQ